MLQFKQDNLRITLKWNLQFCWCFFSMNIKLPGLPSGFMKLMPLLESTASTAESAVDILGKTSLTSKWY